MKPDDGGSAFPLTAETAVGWHGLSKRDYFAAAALTGLLATGNYNVLNCNTAKLSYEYADDMLAESQKQAVAETERRTK